MKCSAQVWWSVAMAAMVGMAVAQREPPHAGERKAGREGAMRPGPGAAEARLPHEGREPLPEAMVEDRLLDVLLQNENAAQHLGLSGAQMEKLRAGAEGRRQEAERLGSELERIALEQARLLSAEQVDEAALMEAVDRAFVARAQMAKLRVRQLVLLRQTLSPEQLQNARGVVRRRMQQREAMGFPPHAERPDGPPGQRLRDGTGGPRAGGERGPAAERERGEGPGPRRGPEGRPRDTL